MFCQSGFLDVIRGHFVDVIKAVLDKIPIS